MTGITQHPGTARWSRWRIAGWGSAAALLMVPLVAMQFSDEWQWGFFDFVFMGALLGSAGLAIEGALRSTGDRAYRWGAGVAVAGTFLLLWMNAAVGLIGGDGDRANLLVPVVPMVGLIVAMLGRWRARGMMRALLAMAVAQVLVVVTAVLAGWDRALPQQPPKAVVLGAIYTAIWLVSAWLFHRTATAAPATRRV